MITRYQKFDDFNQYLWSLRFRELSKYKPMKLGEITKCFHFPSALLSLET